MRSSSAAVLASERSGLMSGLSRMIKESAIAAVITDPNLPDNPIVDCNASFLALTGYLREEIIGQNCRLLSGPNSEEEASDALRAAIAGQVPVVVDILNYRKDGSQFRNSVMVAPIFDDHGRLAAFLGSQAETTADSLQTPSSRNQSARQRIEALSPRQREVLVELASGKLIKQIAHDLHLSDRTVKLHRAAALKALGFRTTAEAIRLVVEASL